MRLDELIKKIYSFYIVRFIRRKRVKIEFLGLQILSYS
jgi:hypothetical protein